MGTGRTIYAPLVSVGQAETSLTKKKDLDNEQRKKVASGFCQEPMRTNGECSSANRHIINVLNCICILKCDRRTNGARQFDLSLRELGTLACGLTGLSWDQSKKNSQKRQ